MLSLGQAAQEAGVSKSSVSRAIAKGRLSATRNDKRGWDIDESELFRWCTTLRVGNGKLERTGTPHWNPAGTDSASEIAVLRAKAEVRDELCQVLKDQIVDLRRERDKWQTQAEAQRLLAAPKRRWWRRTG